MLYTSNEANKLLKQYKEELNQEYLKERQSCKYTLSVDESAEGNVPEYDFEKTKLRIESLQKTIRKIKHAINVFNTTTNVEGFDMTVDEILVALPMWNCRLLAVKEMAGILPKTRKTISLSKFVEYEYANYDIEEAKAAYDTLQCLISYAQTALDTLNNTKKFEIDI